MRFYYYSNGSTLYSVGKGVWGNLWTVKSFLAILKDCQPHQDHRIILHSSMMLDLRYDLLCKGLTDSKKNDEIMMIHTFVCIPVLSVPPDRVHL